MTKFFQIIQNNGIDSNTDLETAKRIRLCNDMSIAGITVGCIVLGYAILNNWSFSVILTISLLLATTFLPPVLNFYKKTLASRVSYLIISFIVILYLSIFMGPDFNFHYFLFGITGLPLMFFGIELDKRSLLWPVLVIIVFFYLEWHFTVFEPLSNNSSSYSNSIRLTNNFIVLISVLNQFYWLVKENDSHVRDINAKSNELEEKNIQLARNLEEVRELQAKNRGLKHFAYIASHDLNEPLRTVDSFVEMIHDEYADASDENINTYFSFIHDAMKRMRTMIDGLLHYSRIGKSGNFKLTNIYQLVHEIELDLKELILEKNAIIQKSALPTIICLPIEIRQLFQNLISNAIKFQRPESNAVITITYENMPDYWEFCVADNGIGISPKKHKDIFQMFTKLHLPAAYEGHGIGLAFCKEIIEIHEGEIWVESSPGEGSRFYFTIQKKVNIE